MEFSDLLAFAPLIVGLLAAGLLAGIMAGLLGVGGGIVMVPAMGLAFGFMGYDAAHYHHVAVGTSLAIIIATGISSARAHHRRDAVMLDVVKLWAPFIVVASLLGGLSARYYSGDVLRLIFGFVAIVLALNVVFQLQKRFLGTLSGTPTMHRVAATIVGYISALMGIGGGSLSVPTLNAIGHDMHKCVGTGAALGVLIAVPAALGFAVSGLGIEGRPPLSIGYVNLPAMFLIGFVATFAAPLGARLAHALDKQVLSFVFSIFLALVGLRMFWQVLTG